MSQGSERRRKGKSRPKVAASLAADLVVDESTAGLRKRAQEHRQNGSGRLTDPGSTSENAKNPGPIYPPRGADGRFALRILTRIVKEYSKERT